MSIGILTMYINYAKQNVHPKLTPDQVRAYKKLMLTWEEWVMIQVLIKKNYCNHKTVGINDPDYLKPMRRRDYTVEVSDVKEKLVDWCNQLLRHMLRIQKQVRFDMGLVQTGHSVDEQISEKNSKHGW